MSQWFLSYSLYCCCFISAYFFHNYLSLYGSWQKKLSPQSASKRFPSFGSPANGNKSNAKKSRFRPNRNLTGTIYHWSVTLRSFSVVLNSAKRDANGFFKVLLLSSHLLISRHPVQNSKFDQCAVTGYCSFKACSFYIRIIYLPTFFRAKCVRFSSCNDQDFRPFSADFWVPLKVTLSVMW